MKKILICYHSSQFGGVEKHILDIISGLSKDFEIYIACPSGPLVEDYMHAGAKKHYEIYPKFEADLGYSLKIMNLIKSEKIDVIHSHELLTGSLATLGGWLGGCPKRIYHVHTSFTQWRYSSLKKIPALIINTIVNFIVGNVFATDIIALTESVKKIRISKEFIFANKIRVIPNGIYLEQFRYDSEGRDELRASLGIKEGQFVIGNISRFTEEKGHFVLIDAFKMIESYDSSNTYVLVLAGGGTMQNELQLKVEELGLNNKVHFLGNFKEEDKNKILSSFECFAFPSYAEGFGIVIAEAMSVGIPVIASNLEVLKDVGGSSIEYFNTGNAKELSGKILALSKEIGSYKDISEKEKLQANKFSIQKFWQAYSSLYS